jgi:hypothetical protein
MVARLAIALVVASIPAATAAAATPVAPRHVSAGQSFAVARGATGYYLSRDTKRSVDDVRLIGRPKANKLFVPSIAAGSYRLLACSGTHCAASHNLVAVGAGTATQVQAFSDSHDPQEQYLAGNAHFDPSICPVPAPPGALPSTAGALSAARALLAQAAGPQGLAAFQRSAAYKSADAGESAAVEAVALGKPGAALAALLRAHELKPDEPRYLAAAAAILTGLGHPKEALALLNGATTLAPSASAPFGINTQAVALNAKGEALIALGHFADAETFLRAAIAIEPLLAEAKQNLAIALMCGQKNDEAMRFLRVGTVRQGTLNPDGSIALPPIENLLDMTHGKTATLPVIPLPESFEVAKKSEGFYGAISQTSADRLHAMRTRDIGLMNENFAHPDSLFTQQRDLEIIKLALDPPALHAQKDALVKLVSATASNVLGIADTLGSQSSGWQHDAGMACAGLQNTNPAAYQACYYREYQDRCSGPAHDANNKIVEMLAVEEKAGSDYVAAYYPVASAVLANIANPTVQERWSLIVDESIEATWASPLQALNIWANRARLMYCGTPAPDPPAPSTDGPVTTHSEPCPPSIRGVKLSWKLAGDFALDVNCDKVSVEVSTVVQGWFGAFAQLDWSPRSGKMTIFAGPKLGAKIPGTSLGGSFKDGLYVTFKGDDSIGDFGFRTSVSGGAGFGPFSIKGGDSMDFSFAPVFGLTR